MRTRWMFVLCLLVLGVAGGIAGTAVLMQWQTNRIAPDAQVLLDGDVRQIRFALKNWSNNFQLFRDALDKIDRNAEQEQAALARATAVNTPYLIGLGWAEADRTMHWWIAPPDQQDIRLRNSLRTFWGMPAAQTVSPSSGKAFLVLHQPLRRLENRTRRLVAVYDLDSFFREVLGPSGVRILDRDRPLYESPFIGPGAERALAQDGLRWTILRPSEPASGISRRWLQVLFFSAVLLCAFALWGMLWAAERLRHLATTDPLTGLYNRRFFVERLEEEVDRANRYRRPLSCLMVDLDGFKQVNDRKGHSAGDQVLREVAQEFRVCLRRSDTVARFGGDEFVAVLPETTEEQASSVVRKLRAISSSGAFSPVQLSVGLASLQPGEAAHDLLQRADEDLYAVRALVRGNGIRIAV